MAPKPRFKRCFISLKGAIDGFLRGCRPIIGVDGTHLKGPYKGVLFTAIGLDAENHCYPLAWAVVEFENNDSWGYFFTALLQILGAENHGKWTVLSDRCKVISHLLLLLPLNHLFVIHMIQ